MVASDLHLGQAGAAGKRDLRKMRDEVSKTGPELIVLNGDIFEGKYATGDKDQIREKMESAGEEIRKLLDAAVRANPDVEMLFIYGNHDVFQEVREVMEEMKEDYPNNLRLEESYAKVGDTLFLHSDVPIQVNGHGSHLHMTKQLLTGKMGIEASGQMERDLAHHEEDGEMHWRHIKERRGMEAIKTKGINVVKGALDNLLSRMVYPVDKVSDVILESMRQHDEAVENEEDKLLPGLKRLVIGHIHSPHNSQHRDEATGIETRVTGPSTRMGKPTLLEFEITDQGLENFQPFGCRHAISHCR